MLRCAITPGELALECDAPRRSMASAKLLERCRKLADGVDILLVREKELPAGELTECVREIVGAVGADAVRVLVARRADIAVAAGATGVHLSAADGELSPPEIRRIMPAAFVSVSCHTTDDVHRAVAEGADAVLFAPVFGKRIAAERFLAGVGLQALAQAVEAAGTVPVFALGGVTWNDVEACRSAGAAGIAGIRLFFP
jgi:thiamine-phosphate pyrophosphorylase